MTPSHCSTCGTPITPGTGHYDTPDGLFCLRCGIKIPVPSGVRVTVTIDDPEHKLDRYQLHTKEAS